MAKRKTQNKISRTKATEVFEVGFMAGEAYIVIFVEAHEVDTDCDSLYFSVDGKRVSSFKDYLYYKVLGPVEQFGQKFESLAIPRPE